jgi:hypothetical protein
MPRGRPAKGAKKGQPVKAAADEVEAGRFSFILLFTAVVETPCFGGLERFDVDDVEKVAHVGESSSL